MDSTLSQIIFILNVENFSAIYYDERQAPVARGVHLVIFSTSFQWNSIHLLFRISDGFTAVVLEVNSVWSCERRVQFCRYLRQLSKISTGHVLNHSGNNGCIFFSRTEFLAARFFDTFFIQCIFYYKLPARIEKYYWKVISSRIPVTRPGFISFYLHAVKQSLNSKQNLRPREILSNDRHNLRGVYWIISCIALVPFCFLCGDTLKWVMRWDSAVDKIVWPQCMTGRW